MIGSGALEVPPICGFFTPAVSQSRSYPPLYLGIPAAGGAGGVPLWTGTGQPAPRFLNRQSPPTLLEEWELYGLSIAWGARWSEAGPPQITVFELQLLVNDRRVFSIQDEPVIQPAASAPNIINGAWNADLINPIRVSARDRVGLRVGFEIDAVSDPPVDAFMIGANANNGGNTFQASGWTPSESTISYRTVDLPASRRL